MREGKCDDLSDVKDAEAGFEVAELDGGHEGGSPVHPFFALFRYDLSAVTELIEKFGEGQG